jgi:hypothetical protein
MAEFGKNSSLSAPNFGAAAILPGVPEKCQGEPWTSNRLPHSR